MALEGKLLSRARDRLEERRRVNAAETARRRADTYARIPELRHIDDRLRGIMVELVGLALGRSGRPGQELEAESLTLQSRRAELLRLRQEQGIRDGAFYHFDTPLTVQHETEALRAAGFSSVTVLKNWGQTVTLRANR